MPHRIVRPTKEQVRAYMHARELARRPPPPPDEIRRLLGWRLEAIRPPPSAHEIYRIPTHYPHLTTCMTLELLSAWTRYAQSSFLAPCRICKKPTLCKCENLTA